MKNPEKLATQGTQDKLTLENTAGAINNEQSRETGNIGYIRQFYLINVREYQRGNHKQTIQRNWQHSVNKKVLLNKRQRIPKAQSQMDNLEKLTTYNSST